NSPSPAVSERRSTAILPLKRFVTPSIAKPNASGASACSAKHLRLALLHLLRRQVLFVGCKGPRKTERIFHMTVAIAPELIGNRHSGRATGCHSLLKTGVGVRHVEMHYHRPIPLRDRG